MMIVQSALTEFLKALNADSATLGVTYMATGSGTNTAAKSDTKLQTEVFRKAISSHNYSASAFTAKLSLAPAESAFHIREIGIFAGGSSTPDSGTLIARFNVDVDKNASTQYLLSYVLTLA